MAKKAYIVVNKQQEREVLEQLEREGMVWGIINEKPTDFNPRTSYLVSFPYVIFVDDVISWNFISRLEDEEIVFDGRKEENMSDKYAVSQEFMNELEDWKLNTVGGIFINDDDIEDLPYIIVSWWIGDSSDEENNNRLIAIIRWVNGEDMFEVEKPKKWVVRSKETDNDGEYLYMYLDSFHGMQLTKTTYKTASATKFDTKEEAQSWANSHQEVVEVDE